MHQWYMYNVHVDQQCFSAKTLKLKVGECIPWCHSLWEALKYMLHFSKCLSTSIISVCLVLSSRHGVVVTDNITCFKVIVIGNLKANSVI